MDDLEYKKILDVLESIKYGLMAICLSLGCIIGLLISK